MELLKQNVENAIDAIANELHSMDKATQLIVRSQLKRIGQAVIMCEARIDGKGHDEDMTYVQIARSDNITGEPSVNPDKTGSEVAKGK